MNFDRSRLRRGVPVLCWTAVVVAASVATPPAGSLSPTGPAGFGVDKWLHLGAYWVTAALAAVASESRGRRTLVVAVAFAVALGVGLELVQAALPARSFDPADAAVNGVGACLGAATYAVGRRLEGARNRRETAEGDGG